MLRPSHLLPLIALLGCSSSSSKSPGSSSNDGGAGGQEGGSVGAEAGSDAGAGGDAGDDGGAADASLDDPPIPAKYQAFATAFDAERQKLGASGAAVAILEKGQLTFFHGFGTKGPNSTDPVRARTLFRIGSMTKALTATTFMTLVAQGKADPATTIVAAAPGVDLSSSCPACAQTLTLDLLMSHQSGLYDYIALDGPTADSELSTFLSSTTFAGNDYFMDPSGTFWNYSNPNFYLVGFAAEHAAGVPYRQAVADRVLGPLGMTRTFFLPSDVTADGDFTDGSSTDTTGKPWDVNPASYDNGWARPAGFAFSSVLDYARFVQFLYAGNAAVLPDAQRTKMMTPAVSLDEVGSIAQYGYGLFLDQGFALGSSYYPTALVSHGGDINGFASDFYLVPSTGFGIVTFANADAAHFGTSLVDAFQSFGDLPAPAAVPAAYTPDPASYPQLAGTYADPQNVGNIVVSVSAGTVGVSMPALDTASIPYDKTLTPLSLDNFSFNVQGQPVEVTFVKGSSGAYQWFRTRFFVGDLIAGDGGATPGPRPPPFDVARFLRRLHTHL
jgi:CubicO group peptidase (beta-lactamase class C family)